MPEAFQSVPVWMMLAGFLLMLGPLVTLHELGHYLVGRWCGVKAEVFSVGFGKELFGWTDARGTRWQIAAIPLGGFVKFAGDMSPASEPSEEYLALPAHERAQCFQAKTLWQKTMIVAAGPIANIIIALTIFAAFFMVYGKPVALDPETTNIVSEFAADGSAARDAGVQIGDRIIAVDGKTMTNPREVARAVMLELGKELELTIIRDGREIIVPVQTRVIEETDQFGNVSRLGRIGVAFGDAQMTFEQVGPIEASVLSAEAVADGFVMIVTGLKQIIVGERSVKEMGGPLTMAKFSGEQLSLGLPEFVYFVAFVSINLAFINLLPIPVLDGGHLAFYAVEAIRRKPLSARSQEYAFRTGMALVLTLMVFVTLIDIAKLPIFGS